VDGYKTLTYHIVVGLLSVVGFFKPELASQLPTADVITDEALKVFAGVTFFLSVGGVVLRFVTKGPVGALGTVPPDLKALAFVALLIGSAASLSACVTTPKTPAQSLAVAEVTLAGAYTAATNLHQAGLMTEDEAQYVGAKLDEAYKLVLDARIVFELSTSSARDIREAEDNLSLAIELLESLSLVLRGYAERVGLVQPIPEPASLGVAI
jgi:hypothetical protein